MTNSFPPNFRVSAGLPGVLHHMPAPDPLLLRCAGHRVLDADLPPVPHPVSPVQRSVTNLPCCLTDLESSVCQKSIQTLPCCSNTRNDFQSRFTIQYTNLARTNEKWTKKQGKFGLFKHTKFNYWTNLLGPS